MIRWIPGVLLFLVWGLVFTAASVFFSSRQLFPLTRAFFRAMLIVSGIRVEGNQPARDLPDGVVFMLNHVSVLDHFVIAAVSTHFMVGVESRGNHRLPIYGFLSRRWGNIAIDRRNPEAAKKTLEDARATLTSGTSIAIAPEGTRSLDGRLQPFKKGGFHLATGTNAIVVPITLKGMYDIAPKGSVRLRPGKVRIRFHDPINSAGHSVESLRDQVRSVMLAALASD